MWRRLRSDSADIFETFLQHVVWVYPPASNDVDTEDDCRCAERKWSVRMVTLNVELLFKVDFKKPKNGPFQGQRNIYNVRTL